MTVIDEMHYKPKGYQRAFFETKNQKYPFSLRRNKRKDTGEVSYDINDKGFPCFHKQSMDGDYYNQETEIFLTKEYDGKYKSHLVNVIDSMFDNNIPGLPLDMDYLMNLLRITKARNPQNIKLFGRRTFNELLTTEPDGMLNVDLFLLNKKWCLMKNITNRPFITSDAVPIYKDGHTYFPISKKYYLFITDSDEVHAIGNSLVDGHEKIILNGEEKIKIDPKKLLERKTVDSEEFVNLINAIQLQFFKKYLISGSRTELEKMKIIIDKNGI